MSDEAHETRLEQASKLLRDNGWRVMRPDPFGRPGKFSAALVPESRRQISTTTANRLEFLRKHAGVMPAKQMAQELGCSVGSLYVLASDNNISLRIVKGERRA